VVEVPEGVHDQNQTIRSLLEGWYQSHADKRLKEKTDRLSRHPYQGSQRIDERKRSMTINESSLPSIWQHTQVHVSGAITTFRADRSKQENKKNNRELKGYLRNKGYGVTSVSGNYIEQFGTENGKEVTKSSLFVVDLNDEGKLEKDLKILGAKYDQDSVLIVPKGGKGAYLVGTSDRDDAFPPKNKKETVGNSKFGKVAGQFLSRIKGRESAFESVMSYNERWADAILAVRVEERMQHDQHTQNRKV